MNFKSDDWQSVRALPLLVPLFSKETARQTVLTGNLFVKRLFPFRLPDVAIRLLQLHLRESNTALMAVFESETPG